ncbi:hypothetical protein NEOLEDRAFT_440225 [Neolentinus lepideus HHB14362 ss-1]|uniref:Uncharacterized protein n=1 Tax=Neolentinus lepideus HHB14362 ss-1 TaxID=1314782 RepID=A0A165RXK0_9AGAM|nr:hypothetical protein NEOLEDRAFT_440225 [Neolentinus lepideus HHB14362 ss-1]
MLIGRSENSRVVFKLRPRKSQVSAGTAALWVADRIDLADSFSWPPERFKRRSPLGRDPERAQKLSAGGYQLELRWATCMPLHASLVFSILSTSFLFRDEMSIYTTLMHARTISIWRKPNISDTSMSRARQARIRSGLRLSLLVQRSTQVWSFARRIHLALPCFNSRHLARANFIPRLLSRLQLGRDHYNELSSEARLWDY